MSSSEKKVYVLQVGVVGPSLSILSFGVKWQNIRDKEARLRLCLLSRNWLKR